MNVPRHSSFVNILNQFIWFEKKIADIPTKLFYTTTMYMIDKINYVEGNNELQSISYMD